MNKGKSAIFFSPNCDSESKEAVHTSLQIRTEALGEKYMDYLRLPSGEVRVLSTMSLAGCEVWWEDGRRRT